MTTSEKYLFQVRLSQAERRQIRTLAASQGLTHQHAVVAAFAAWAEKLQASAAVETQEREAGHPTPAGKTKPARAAESAAGAAAGSWLQRAAKLDWTKCPEVEVMQGKNRRLWVLMGTLAPLAEVLRGVADGHPVEEVAEAFVLELPQLAKVLEFAGATERRG